MANPDDFLRDDQKKAREKNSKLNQGANSFQGMAQKSEQSFDQSQSRTRNDGNYDSANKKTGQKPEAPKQQQSIVQSKEKLEGSKAKTSQQSNTLNQQLNSAKAAKDTAKTQTATQSASEQDKKAKSM